MTTLINYLVNKAIGKSLIKELKLPVKLMLCGRFVYYYVLFVCYCSWGTPMLLLITRSWVRCMKQVNSPRLSGRSRSGRASGMRT